MKHPGRDCHVSSSKRKPVGLPKPNGSDNLFARGNPALYGLMALLCLSLYAWTIDFPFVFDDYYYLKDNPLFKEGVRLPVIGEIRDLIYKARELQVDPDLAYNIILRPVAYASFYLNHALDGFDPRWYRVINVGIHLCNGLMVLTLLRLLTSELVRRDELKQKSALFLPVAGGLLFLVHPLAVESVTYVIQRFTSLGLAWFLASTIAYLLSAQATNRAPRVAWLTASSVLLLAGILTKEDCFTMPLVAMLIDRLVFRTQTKLALLRVLPLFLVSLVTPLLVMYIAQVRDGGNVTVVQAMQLVDRQPESWGIWTYFVSQIRVVAEYIGALVWPFGLSLTPQASAFSSMWHWEVIWPLLIMTSVMLAILISVLRRPSDGRQRLMLVGGLWFFVTISVSSSIIPLPELASLHRTYLPSFGFFLVAGCLLDYAREWLSRVLGHRQPVAACLLSALVLPLSVVTCWQNHLWRTNITLWSYCVGQNPGSFPAWNNLGAAYFEAGDLSRALECFEKVVAIEPRYQGAQLNVSHVLLLQGRWQECHDRTIQMMERDPALQRSVAAIYNVAASQIGLGKIDHGRQLLHALASNGSGYPPASELLAKVDAVQPRANIVDGGSEIVQSGQTLSTFIPAGGGDSSAE
ncbi:MAG: tetratricopeptide repeat protein [Verrucomicrobiaceae bacterium]|nr:tetratricopeptide repeat protein [Verrucomicrobiaceae bacterium]